MEVTSQMNWTNLYINQKQVEDFDSNNPKWEGMMNPMLKINMELFSLSPLLRLSCDRSGAVKRNYLKRGERRRRGGKNRLTTTF